MLNHKVLTRQDIGDVANYYGDGADDYYAKEGESQVWQGKGAEILGLTGTVDRERFRDLLAGRITPNGESVRTSTRDDSKTRIGIDLTFSAPKSVSIVALVGGDAAMIAAHDIAVQRALEHAEAFAQARIKEGGKSRIEMTGNLIVAKFRHETTRAQDPDLHTHAVVMNLTRRADGQWRALRNDEIVKMTRYLGAIYRAELARELEGHGHQLRHGRDGTFDLAAISRDQVLAFSRRSAEIEAHLASRGLTAETASAAERQMATMKTRSKKDANLDRAGLHQQWRDRAAELGISFDRSANDPSAASASSDQPQHSTATALDALADAEAAKRAVRFAINHLTEREAVISKSTLTDMALKHDLGRTNVTAIHAAVADAVATGRLVEEVPLYHGVGAAPHTAQTEADWVSRLIGSGETPATALERFQAALAAGGLIRREPRYTTSIAIARERQVLAIEQAGRGGVNPIMSREAAARYFAKQSLNAGQQAAATLILSTNNRVVGIEGYAGTGKSHMLDKAKTRIMAEGFARAGYDFQALAPYGTQKQALRELGVNARTVAAFLKATDKKITDRTVLVVDEAAVIPARQMAALLSAAEKAGARVALVFDRAQTQAIEAGRPVDQLVRNGMETTHMTEIQRQRDPQLKEAVELAARGKTRASLARIPSVTEVTHDQERRAAVAKAYLNLAPQEREKTLIVSGTNEARREINAYVRDGLGLAGKGKDYNLLIRHDTTQEQRRYARNYEVGDTIQPENDYAKFGLKRGELYKVVETGPANNLTVEGAAGQRHTFAPYNTKLSVYRTVREELAPGDLVKITRNDAQLDVANGDRFRVSSLNSREINLTNGKRNITLPADKPVHLDHAYTTTTHSSQSLTEDRTILDLDTKTRTTSKSTFYVGISRARHETHIFTDSHERLPAAIRRHTQKTAALDLARDRRPPDELDIERAAQARQRDLARDVRSRVAALGRG